MSRNLQPLDREDLTNITRYEFLGWFRRMSDDHQKPDNATHYFFIKGGTAYLRERYQDLDRAESEAGCAIAPPYQYGRCV